MTDKPVNPADEKLRADYLRLAVVLGDTVAKKTQLERDISKLSAKMLELCEKRQKLRKDAGNE